MNSLISPNSAFGDGVNWAKVADTLKGLFYSPLIGFIGLCCSRSRPCCGASPNCSQRLRAKSRAGVDSRVLVLTLRCYLLVIR